MCYLWTHCKTLTINIQTTHINYGPHLGKIGNQNSAFGESFGKTLSDRQKWKVTDLRVGFENM